MHADRKVAKCIALAACVLLAIASAVRAGAVVELSVTDRGTLHSDRQGGWAAVSDRTETRLGGSWTARSFTVAEKLLGQAHWKLASGEGRNADAS